MRGSPATVPRSFNAEGRAKRFVVKGGHTYVDRSIRNGVPLCATTPKSRRLTHARDSDRRCWKPSHCSMLALSLSVASLIPHSWTQILPVHEMRPPLLEGIFHPQ